MLIYSSFGWKMENNIHEKYLSSLNEILNFDLSCLGCVNDSFKRPELKLPFHLVTEKEKS